MRDFLYLFFMVGTASPRAMPSPPTSSIPLPLPLPPLTSFTTGTGSVTSPALTATTLASLPPSSGLSSPPRELKKDQPVLKLQMPVSSPPSKSAAGAAGVPVLGGSSSLAAAALGVNQSVLDDVGGTCSLLLFFFFFFFLF
jgi:hypothetical protein